MAAERIKDFDESYGYLLKYVGWILVGIAIYFGDGRYVKKEDYGQDQKHWVAEREHAETEQKAFSKSLNEVSFTLEKIVIPKLTGLDTALAELRGELKVRTEKRFDKDDGAALEARIDSLQKDLSSLKTLVAQLRYAAGIREEG